MESPIIFKDLIKDVVTLMTTSAPVYYYGHLVDITGSLSIKTRAVSKKYPAVILPLDIIEEFDGVSSNWANVTFSIFLVTRTKKEYTAEQRFDNVFKTYLYPMYVEFKEAMLASGYFSGLKHVDKLPHTKIDRLFWGRSAAFGNEANMLNDYIDAIELKDIKVTVKPDAYKCKSYIK